jgi:hypothetical protein
VLTGSSGNCAVSCQLQRRGLRDGNVSGKNKKKFYNLNNLTGRRINVYFPPVPTSLAEDAPMTSKPSISSNLTASPIDVGEKREEQSKIVPSWDLDGDKGGPTYIEKPDNAPRVEGERPYSCETLYAARS